ncbi:MAG: MlrC C-terminal domain-containing protein, partial [Bacteroidota bacterium]
AEATAHELAELNWEVRDKPHPVPYSIEEAILKTKKLWFRRLFGTLVFCDTSDIVAAGAPGENTLIVSQLLDESEGLTSYIPLRDSQVATEHFDTSIGNVVALNIGSKLETSYNEPLQFEAKLVRKAETDFGKTLVFRHNKLSLVITELPCPAFWPSFFTKLGLSLWRADIVVVKNLFPFRLFYALYNRKTLNVATAGTTNLDVHQLAYSKIPRPIYPLDAIKDWKEVKKAV